MKTVYLCGGINGLTDADCKDWREMAKSALTERYRILDPMRRDYRGKELESVREIVQGDEADICESDILLVNAERPSWGTAMEVRLAWGSGKRIVTVCPSDKPSPWLIYHSSVVHRSLDAAIAQLIGEA